MVVCLTRWSAEQEHHRELYSHHSSLHLWLPAQVWVLSSAEILWWLCSCMVYQWWTSMTLHLCKNTVRSIFMQWGAYQSITTVHLLVERMHSCDRQHLFLIPACERSTASNKTCAINPVVLSRQKILLALWFYWVFLSVGAITLQIGLIGRIFSWNPVTAWETEDEKIRSRRRAGTWQWWRR